MGATESRLNSPVNSCVTQSEIIPIAFRWTIRNFSNHLHKIGYKLNSSAFSTEDNRHKSKWHITVYPNGDVKDSEGYLSMYLIFDPDSTGTANVPAFQFSLLSSDTKKSFNGPKSAPHEFNKLTKSWGWAKLIPTDTLLNENSELVQDDTLTIYCEINLSIESTNNVGKVLNTEIPECRLGDDFITLFDNEFLSDVILMASGKQFKVHKAVLAARSPVFAAMFSIEVKEKYQYVIEIGDISDEVLYNLLQFIYSGKAPEETSVKLISDLLATADKYDIKRLKIICEKILIPQLTIKNAAELLILADMHDATQLKEVAMKFVNTYITGVKKVDSWMSLVEHHPSLLDELFNSHLQQDPTPKTKDNK